MINLKSKLLDLPFINVVVTCDDLENGEKEILYHKPHLLFLDIEVNGRSIFQLLERLESRKMDFGIFFITAHHDKYLLDAINNCGLKYKFAYLGKPINWIKLISKLNTLRKELLSVNDPEDFLLVQFQGGMLKLFFDEIFYCEAAGNQSIIHTTDEKKEIVNFNLKQLDDKLPKKFFYRMSGQHIINSRYFRKVYRANNSFVVALRIGLNEAKLHLPVKQWKGFKERFEVLEAT